MAYEMKATLGYDEAAVSAGYLWDTDVFVEGMSIEFTGTTDSSSGRSEVWWTSTARHHHASRAAVHSLLFLGDKHSERGDHTCACESYVQGLEMSTLDGGAWGMLADQ